MSHWWQGRLCAFDFETTAPNPNAARIVTAHVAFVGGGVEPEETSWLADPGEPIPPEAVAIHGITNEMCTEHGKPAFTVVAEVALHLAYAVAREWPIVAFNASYDLTVLACEAKRQNVNGRILPLLERALIFDPFVVDKALDKYRKGSRKLADVCAFHGIKLDNAHDAGADALAAARLAYKLAAKHGLHDLVELQTQQRIWAREQAIGLAAYLKSQGQTRDLPEPGDWPIRITREEQVA